ncbi:unnamed protein product [Sphagnum troendelagicum]|uniref:Superoxide dismutase copper chaperone n=1 Tax=Sphagnum troendelagicum TaxID=128251 RepID=A0ABP0U6B2_9BRYO
MAVLRALGLPSLLPTAAAATLAISASISPPLKSLNSSPRSSFLLSHSACLFVCLRVCVLGVRSHIVSSLIEQGLEDGSKDGAPLPDLVTEFMVDMSCEGCVKSVRTKLEPLEGVKSVDVDLGNQVVRVLGSATVKNLSAALAQSGRKARLIGQGLPENFALSAAVAEFKGPEIHGVVRFVQVSMELARIEASFSGLPPGSHGWSINEYGDLTRGAASTGQIFNTSTNQQDVPVGDLGVLEANEGGDAEYSGTKEMLKVGDLIGRALVVYGDHDKSRPGTSAAVIARSAGVGENYKKLCSCDGTVIWESTPNDYARV